MMNRADQCDFADRRDFDSHYEYWDKVIWDGIRGGEMRKIQDVVFEEKTIEVRKETQCDAEIVICNNGERIASVFLNSAELLLLQSDIAELLYHLPH